MSRLHLFELADQPWYPRSLADAGTAYLQTLSDRVGLSAGMAPLVQRALERSGATSIVDLCSGGGGPVAGVQAALDTPVSWVLTDSIPNTASLSNIVRPTTTRSPGEATVRLHPDPVDAAAVPSDLRGLRTVFNALHHFRPEDARAVLADAQAAGQPILVVEASERALLPLTIGTAFIPLFVWLMMPLVRPVRVSWLLLTYVLPLLPWAIAWDGWVSHWRTYSLPEQAQLVAPLTRPGWTWKMGQDRVGPGRITWLLGMPTDPA